MREEADKEYRNEIDPLYKSKYLTKHSTKEGREGPPVYITMNKEFKVNNEVSHQALSVALVPQTRT